MNEKNEFGFIKDEYNSIFKKVFKDNVKLKKMHIDIYSENPLKPSSSFSLLLRTIEENVIVSNDRNRFILKMDNKFKTYIMNIKLEDIAECFVEIVDDYCFEFILNIQNIYYKMIVFN